MAQVEVSTTDLHVGEKVKPFARYMIRNSDLAMIMYPLDEQLYLHVYDHVNLQSKDFVTLTAREFLQWSKQVKCAHKKAPSHGTPGFLKLFHLKSTLSGGTSHYLKLNHMELYSLLEMKPAVKRLIQEFTSTRLRKITEHLKA